MSDVFISYARSTEPEAHAIAEALRALGHEVWRDDQIAAHQAFGKVIEQRLAEAKVVLVLWSADAAESEWGRSEAS
ncbi:MAG TPA: toll/interleukin-1 receptor domain-containing protein, partial [Phenylobacterium sp.]|nr:toll/interleukin-1 receptor domain-containing protein [Phenylobacterium sp.]